MKLTPAERWILANQYRLMQMLSDRPVSLYEHAIKILENGYEDQYDYAAQYLRETPFPQDVAQEVHDILTMFSQLQWTRDRLSDPDIVSSPRLEFRGFDGNNNPEHLSYAHFLHEKGDYRELGQLLRVNSHADNIGTYRAMVRAWKSIPVDHRGLQMTEEDVQMILNAPRNGGERA